MSQSFDSFLGGRIKLLQPSKGYRAGIEPIFLSAAVNVAPDDLVLDVGMGVGTAACALAARHPEAHITGIEIQMDLVKLAKENVVANNFSDRVAIIAGDILSENLSLRPYSFHHVMTNPPYYEHARSKLSPIPGKAQANTETINLEQWLRFCLSMLRPKGTFTIIHRAERLHDILSHLIPHLGNIIVYPLWAGVHKPAKRIIVQGRKNAGTEWQLASGIVLHGSEDKYTPEAEAILRHAEPLLVTP